MLNTNISNSQDTNRKNNLVYLSPKEVDYKNIKDLTSEESLKLNRTINFICDLIKTH